MHASGISVASIEAFESGYGALPDPLIIRHAISARLAMDRMIVTTERFERSGAQRVRFSVLGQRLLRVLDL